MRNGRSAALIRAFTSIRPLWNSTIPASSRDSFKSESISHSILKNSSSVSRSRAFRSFSPGLFFSRDRIRFALVSGVRS